MSRQLLAIFMLGLVLVVIQTSAASSQQRHPDSSIDTAVDTGIDSDSKQGNSDLAMLMFLLLNGGHFLQCSMLVTMVAAALGMIAAHGFLASTLHN